MKKSFIVRVIAALALISALPCLPSCGGEYDMAADDTVYSMQKIDEKCAYYPCSAVMANMKTLGMSPYEAPGEAYYLCMDPECRHNGFSCPAYSEGYTATLVVHPKGNDTTLYTFGKPYPYKYVDGEYIPMSKDESWVTEVRAFDTATGESRRVCMTSLCHVMGAWCFRGKLYMWAYYCKGGGASVRIGMADIKTGEFSYLQSNTKTKMIGIANDRVWYITERGEIGSCSLSLDDVRVEYEIGQESIRAHEVSETLRAYLSGGIIYFERNCRTPDEIKDEENADFYMISDIYALDVNDIGSGERLVAEGVYQFVPHGEDLVYTKIDCERFGTGCPDGGTMYYCDIKTGDTSSIVTDCGVSFEEIYEAADGRVLFGGLRYRDIEKSSNPDGREYLCMLDISSGEWLVLCGKVRLDSDRFPDT